MAKSSPLTVQVLWSPAPRRVEQVTLSLPQGSTVVDALHAAGLGPLPVGQWVGVWGRKHGLNHHLRDHDRVEVYRPLLVDPKVARRERFRKQGTRGAGLFAKRRVGAQAGY